MVRHRRRSKNVWPGDHAHHSRAAKKGWRRRSHNPGRGGVGTLSFKRPTKLLTAGFQPSSLMSAGAIALGVFGNAWVRNAITSRVKFLGGTAASYATGLGTAGLMLFVPKVGKQLFIGGVVGEAARAIQSLVLPKLLPGYSPSGPLGDMDDYVTAGQLSDYATVSQLSDFMTVEDMEVADSPAGHPAHPTAPKAAVHPAVAHAARQHAVKHKRVGDYFNADSVVE